jgi:hypothetical protein
MLAKPVTPQVDHFLADSELPGDAHDGEALGPKKDDSRTRGHSILYRTSANQAFQFTPDGPLEMHYPRGRRPMAPRAELFLHALPLNTHSHLPPNFWRGLLVVLARS